MLSTACVDKDYDLGNIDTDNIAIGDEGSQFRIPLVKVLVSKDEIKNNGGNIEEIFREADIWFPSQLPDGKFVDLVKLQDKDDQTYVNTLFLYGQITSGLPLSLLLDPSFSPTEITFQVGVGADKASNDIPQTQLFAEDLRQIVEGITIRIPVTLTEYYPGKGFSDDRYQIVISLSLLKNGGLKLDI